MLVFYDTANKDGYASIYESHITFNKALLEYFKDVYRVRVGCDLENKKIYIFTYDMDQSLSGEINETSLLPVSLQKSYARICGKQLIRYITDLFDLKIEKKGFLRFRTSYDAKKKAFVIDMKGGI